MAKFNYFSYKNKKLEKFSPDEQEDLIFDLINAFSLMSTMIDSALLLQDLLTEDEIKNLSKRLRIAKLILGAKTHNEIVNDLHCSFATVTKVRIWLNSAGDGFKKVIQKLPDRKKVYKPKRIPGIGYGLPQILAYYLTENFKNKEKKILNKFLEDLRAKTHNDKDLRETNNFKK